MKKKALSDTLIKRIAGTLPSGRVLLKERRSRSAWLGSIKEMMNDYNRIGGASIFREIKMLATAWYLIRRINFPFDYSNVQRIKQGKDYNYLA